MKQLLRLTMLLEAPTGLALMVVPAFVVYLLFGADISGAAVPLGRVAGVALLALGVACWLASYDAESCAARGAASAMAIYNFGTAFVLGAAGLQSPPTGLLLWPVVVLHAGMGAWCVTNLLRKPPERAI